MFKTGHQISSKNHNVYKLLIQLSEKIPVIKPDLPTEQDFTKYKLTWVPASTNSDDVILLMDGSFDRLEVAFYLDNIVNIKYGYDPKQSKINTLDFYAPRLNTVFLNIFRECRKTYATPETNQLLKAKLLTIFSGPDREKAIFGMLHI